MKRLGVLFLVGCLYLSGCDFVESSTQEKIDAVSAKAEEATSVYQNLRDEFLGMIPEKREDISETNPILSEMLKYFDSWDEYTDAQMRVLADPDTGISPFSKSKDDPSAFDAAYENAADKLTKVKLKRVVDGDTLLVELSGEEAYIRLIGINTPESVHPDTEQNTDEGVEASNFTKLLLSSYETIYLEFDSGEYDNYGRILAYVWLSNDTSNLDNMLNAILLERGYAEIMTVKPNTKYAVSFQALVDDEK